MSVENGKVWKIGINVKLYMILIMYKFNNDNVKDDLFYFVIV